jgi:hypothetical protein
VYFDTKPCQVCGADVELRPHARLGENDPDATVDDRVCTNAECPTNNPDDGEAPSP